MTPDETNAALDRLASYYVAYNWPEAVLTEFRRALAPLDAAAVDAAVSACIATSRYCPGVAELLQAMPDAPPVKRGGTWHDCPRCDGTGHVEAEAPPGAVAKEQPWLAKCTTCAGSGRLPGIQEAAAQERTRQLTDEDWTALYAAHDQERHQDGWLYWKSSGKRLNGRQLPPESKLPPLPDGTRPAKLPAGAELITDADLDKVDPDWKR